MTTTPAPDKPAGSSLARLDWPPIVAMAKPFVEEYGHIPPTLRQVFYWLVAVMLAIPNSHGAYKTLSDRLTRAREAGEFPELSDPRRNTENLRGPSGDPEEVLESVLDSVHHFHHRNHTDGQPYTLVIGMEKQGLLTDVLLAVRDKHIPIVPFGGWGSHTYKRRVFDEVAELRRRYDRPVILLYLGDWDASGMTIQRDFVAKTEGAWDEVYRVALTEEQVLRYQLPEQMGKDKDPNRARFVAEFGRNAQVEIDALQRQDLIDLINEAVARYWDDDVYEAVLAAERKDRAKIARVAERLKPIAAQLWEDDDDDDAWDADTSPQV